MNQYMNKNSFGLSAFIMASVITYQYTSNIIVVLERLPLLLIDKNFALFVNFRLTKHKS